MTSNLLDLSREDHAYFYGLMLTDGNLSESERNRGRLTYEISAKDKDIIPKISSMFDVHCGVGERQRNSAFDNKQYNTVFARWYNKALRDSIKKYGFPTRNKSETAEFPKCDNLNIRGFLRGLIDGDGSLGITSNKIPFVSFCSKSKVLSEQFKKAVEPIIGYLPKSKPNLRDGLINMCLYKEKAQAVAKYLYGGAKIALNRKKKKYRQITKWKRPSGMRVMIQKDWSKEQDDYILSHSIEESMKKLCRTKLSVKMRLWRLHNAL